jgi:hypothetical protein
VAHRAAGARGGGGDGGDGHQVLQRDACRHRGAARWPAGA